MSATCSIASSYSRFQASALKNNGVSGQHIDHHIRKRQPLDDPPRGGKLRYRFSAFWHDQEVRDLFVGFPDEFVVVFSVLFWAKGPATLAL